MKPRGLCVCLLCGGHMSRTLPRSHDPEFTEFYRYLEAGSLILDLRK